MKPEDVDVIAEIVKKQSGLIITRDKAYLVESRLGPLARKENCEELSDFINLLKGSPEKRLIDAVTEAMTTNETFFYRDKTPFDLMKAIALPHLAQARTPGGKVRVWTAAASSGQEAYSLAMLIDQAAATLNGLQFEIVGTDIARDVLSKASEGVYSQFEVQRGLPVQMLVKYFEKDGELWRIKPEMRSMCEFKYFNLLENFSALGKFDIVFCRNVLIYFDPPTKKDVLERIASLMPEDGYLFLGAAETVIGLTDAFKPVEGERGLYQRNPDSKSVRSAA